MARTASVTGVLQFTHDIGPVDIFANSASIPADVMLRHMTPERWPTVLQDDPGSMLRMSGDAIVSMRQRQFGRIIDIGAVNARQGQAGQCNYAASKAGVPGLPRALVRESASRHVTVNATAPVCCDTGVVASRAPATPQRTEASIPSGRLDLPAEVVRAAACITGATVDVTGAQSVR
ncbi:SDR family NAD(P)-dependent oxidoreductase [Massilia atriviolacea]|nr:SDR family NAD(P)-dependent oxidoreductase [Massilia atriviolacea]